MRTHLREPNGTQRFQRHIPVCKRSKWDFENRLHQAIAAVCGNVDWILAPRFLKDIEIETIKRAKSDLAVRKKPLTAGYLIAELKFGFWTSLADSRYDKMWHTIIKPIFPAMPNTIRTRAEISKRLHSVRHLRNAVSHHHSIWHWKDLEQRYADIYKLLEWMEPAYAACVKAHDRFPSVFKSGPLQFV